MLTGVAMIAIYNETTQEKQMYEGNQRGIEIYENEQLVAVGGMKDFIIDNDMEGTDEAKAILSLEQGASTNVSTGQGWVKIRRNDDV